MIDRWEIGNPEFIEYDLAEHKVLRTIPWSADFEPWTTTPSCATRPTASSCVFGHRILIFETATMKQVDAWDLSIPIESGMGRLDPGSFDESTDRPGFVTGVFTMRDALQKRDLLVVGQMNLTAKSVETFRSVRRRSVVTSASPFRPIARARTCCTSKSAATELWTIDMATHRVLSRVPVPSRPRMQVRASSSDQLLYFYEAGRLIEVYTADASKRLRTITLDSDMMYGTFVIVPSSAAAAPR